MTIWNTLEDMGVLGARNQPASKKSKHQISTNQNVNANWEYHNVSAGSDPLFYISSRINKYKLTLK